MRRCQILRVAQFHVRCTRLDRLEDRDEDTARHVAVAARGTPLDEDPHSADSHAHRATGLAPQPIHLKPGSVLPGSGGN